jgi:hypothetical protein
MNEKTIISHITTGSLFVDDDMMRLIKITTIPDIDLDIEAHMWNDMSSWIIGSIPAK